MTDEHDFLDVPDDFRVDVPISYGNRINGVCLDGHNCTIANALHDNHKRLGIIDLRRRGVSRTMVSFTLDPRVHPWAVEGQLYRGRLTDASAQLAVELDDWWDRPKAHARHKRQLAKLAAASVDGRRTIWDVVTIVAPSPSQRKGYRSGSAGEHRGPRPPVSGLPNRIYSGANA